MDPDHKDDGGNLEQPLAAEGEDTHGVENETVEAPFVITNRRGTDPEYKPFEMQYDQYDLPRTLLDWRRAPRSANMTAR
jgi:hypothetical protein